MSGSDDYTSEDAACDREAETERVRVGKMLARQRTHMKKASPEVHRRAAILLAGICEIYHSRDGTPFLKINGWMAPEWELRDECLGILKEIGVE